MKYKYTNIELNTKILRLFASSSRRILPYYLQDDTELNNFFNSDRHLNYWAFIVTSTQNHGINIYLTSSKYSNK